MNDLIQILLVESKKRVNKCLIPEVSNHVSTFSTLINVLFPIRNTASFSISKSSHI